MSSVDLKHLAIKNKFKSEISKNIKDAINRFPSNEKKTIVIFGSLYLAGYVLSIN